MEDERKKSEQKEKTAENASERKPEPQPSDQWVWDMKQELEDYIEDQGIYIRQ